MANIGIYGGSFNPPHKGHMLAAAQCRAALGLERVIVIPAAVPPHKALADGSPDAQTRLALTKLAVKGLDGFEVSDMELRREGPSYTVDTLRQLSAQHPDDALWLMMGTDMFLSFASWREPEQIARLARIVCFARTAVDAALKERLEAQAALLRTEFGAEVTLLHNEFRTFRRPRRAGSCSSGWRMRSCSRRSWPISGKTASTGWDGITGRFRLTS